MANNSNKRTFKVLCNEMQAVLDQGQMTKDRLLATLPLLVEVSEKLVSFRKVCAAAAKLHAELNQSCSAYALKHEGIFIGGKLNTDGKDVRHGDLEVGDEVYHFAAGYNGFVRTDGESMTKGFIETLPEEWLKSKRELDITGIGRAGVTEEELDRHGLAPKPNNVWSRTQNAAENGLE